MKCRTMLMRICAGLLCAMFLLILVRVFTNDVLYKKLGVSNGVTRVILVGLEGGTTPGEKRERLRIDWAKLYPFYGEQKNTNGRMPKVGWGDKTTAKIKQAEKRAESWAGDKLAGYYWVVDAKTTYDRWIGWMFGFENTTNIRQYNESYLMEIMAKASKDNIEERILSMKEFSDFCGKEGIPFLYVQAPYKVSREDEIRHRDDWRSYANENADQLVRGLESRQVNVLDLRDAVEAEGKDNISLFFHTDHHWKPETALWATNLIAKRLTQLADLDYTYDASLLQESAYDKKIYKNNFLGSQGRRVTLTFAKPEDISIFYPKEKTSFSIEIPLYGIKQDGDFSIGYDMNELREGDYYHRNAYGAYGYGDMPYINVLNHDLPQGKHVLLIKDSFADSVGMFLARTLGRLEIVDLRAFGGSVQTLIREHKPDAVIILYNPSVIGDSPINWQSHSDTFDFR